MKNKISKTEQPCTKHSVSGNFIEKWVDKIVNGSSGFISFEIHELPLYHKGRDIALVEFVVRALANTECAGSKEVLNAIMERRSNCH